MSTFSDYDRERLNNAIRDVKDYPKDGIVFKDITTLLNDAHAFECLMESF